MPTNQLAPLVSTTRINLAGNSFQVIMEMEMEMEMVGVGLMMAAPPFILMVKRMLVIIDSCNYEV